MPISLSGSLNLSGSLTTTGTITATTLVVQTITSSISSITGSTNFGSLVTDTHKFTGSLSITGSMGIGVAAGTNGTKFISAGSATSFFDAAGTRGISIYPSSAGNIHQITSDYIATSYYSIAITARGTNSDLFISSSGNIGIGTTTPDFPLVVKTDASANSIKIIGRSGGDGLLSFYGSNGTTPYLDFSAGATYVNYNAVNSQNYNWYCNSALKMTLTSTGHLQLNNGTALRFNNTAATAVDTLQMFTDGNVYLDAKDNTGGNLIFRNTTTLNERMRITSGGYFKASNDGAYLNATGTYHEFTNNTSTTATTVIRNTAGNFTDNILAIGSSKGSNSNFNHIAAYTSDFSNIVFKVRGDGNVYNVNGVYTSGVSDIKYKEQIVDANSQWEDIKNLRVVNFKFIKDVKENGEDALKHIGFIAQEVEEVSPNLIEEITDNKTSETWKTIKTSIIHTKAIKALQEAMAKIEALEARVQYLENK